MKHIFNLPVFTLAAWSIIFPATAQQENIALGNPVVASSIENSTTAPENVNDALLTTRWSSDWEDNEWIYIELETEYNIHRVVLNWETAFGKSYNIDISFNGIDWETVFEERNGDGSLDAIVFETPVAARYVRMTGLERGTVFGFSLWEFEIFGFDPSERYVDTKGTDADNNCRDLNAPCASITHAIQVSNPGNTIHIAEGIYTESLLIDKSINLNGADETSTVLQAHEQPGAAGARIITIPAKVLVSIRNLTLRHGHVTGGGASGRGGGIRVALSALIMDRVTLYRNDATYGGGIHNTEGDLQLTNVTFNENKANDQGQGGGMYNFNSSPELTNVIFTKNSANSSGGGISNLSNSSPLLTNVSFVGNAANNAGGGIRNSGNCSPSLNGVEFDDNKARIGGGLYNNNSTPTLSGVEFTRNQADTLGGGMANVNNSLPELSNVVFRDNTALHYGGGVSNSLSSATFTNVIFNSNTAKYGGAISNNESSSDILNATFSNNAAEITGGGIHSTSNSASSITNTIMWNNFAGEVGKEIFNDDLSSAALGFSIYSNDPGDMEGGEFDADENSLTSDPLFVDGTNSDLHVQEKSPAINAGDPDTDPQSFTTGTDGVPIDIDGNPRVQDGRIDIGAYELDIVTGVPFKMTGNESKTQLFQNYPNPFNGSTLIGFRIADSGTVLLKVYDILGNEVATLMDKKKPIGDYKVEFDASGMPGGIYLCKLFAKNETVRIIRMVFVGKER